MRYKSGAGTHKPGTVGKAFRPKKKGGRSHQPRGGSTYPSDGGRCASMYRNRARQQGRALRTRRKFDAIHSKNLSVDLGATRTGDALGGLCAGTRPGDHPNVECYPTAPPYYVVTNRAEAHLPYCPGTGCQPFILANPTCIDCTIKCPRFLYAWRLMCMLKVCVGSHGCAGNASLETSTRGAVMA